MPELGTLTCAGCGLLCHDVTVEDSGEHLRLRPECQLGARWFSERWRPPADAPAATIDGQPAEIETALMRAGELLRGARRPQLQGFAGATVEDARAALALADRLGALVTTGPSDGPWPGAPAAPLRGISTATLGEIRDRSRAVVIWREDPETTHPRLLERLGFESPSGGRLLVVVDDHDTATTARADIRLRWPRERDLDTLVTLRDGDVGGLYERLAGVPHAAFVYGSGLTGGAGGQRRALALYELVRRCRTSATWSRSNCRVPRGPGARTTCSRGRPDMAGRVDFASGHPELVIATESLDDVDVTLNIESGPAGGLVVGSASEVWIRTARAGVSAAGTVHRLDGVPLTLQAPRLDGAPTAAVLLTRLLEEVEP